MRMIIQVGLGVDRPEDYEALLNYLFTNFAAPPTELISGNPPQNDVLVNQLAHEFGIPVRRFPVEWVKDGSPNPGAAKLNVGDEIVYASEVPGSAFVAVASGPTDLMLYARQVCATYELPCHLVRVAPTRYDTAKSAGVPGAARDVTPQVQRVVTPASEPYIFPQSHSSLNVFDTCPRQYEAKYITKDVPYVQSPAAAWGDEVHNELEHYLKAGGAHALPSNMQMYKQFADWVLNRAAQNGGQVLAERMAAVDASLAPVPYRSKQRWMGGKIDVTILYPAQRLAEVFDWKTGKVKDDRTQLQMYGALTLANHEDVDTVGAGYIWLEHKQVSPPSYYARDAYAQHWNTFQHKYAQLKDAYVRGIFPPKPNGLCAKWCDVTRCEFHGKGRR